MGAVIMRSGTRKGVFRRLATVMTAAGVLLVSSGLALMATAGPSVAAEEDCVPSDAYTETSEWVETSPGEGWVEVDSRVKTEATEDAWIDLVWHNYNGNLDGTPELDDPNWHAVPGGPPPGQASQHALVPEGTRVPMVPYSTSDENGRGSWFLYTGTFVPGEDAVMEYLFTFDHPAVTCPVVEPPVVEPPTVVVEPPTVEPAEATADTVTPTVVSAGLAGDTSTGDQGLALIVVGLLLLAGAGALVQLKEVERLS